MSSSDAYSQPTSLPPISPAITHSVSVPATGVDIVSSLRSVPATQPARHPVSFPSTSDVPHSVFSRRDCRRSRAPIFYPRAAFCLCHHPCIILREWDVFREDCVRQSVCLFRNCLFLMDHVVRYARKDLVILTYLSLDTSPTLTEHSGTSICTSTFANLR